MSLSDFIERLKASPNVPHATVELDDPEGPATGLPDAYFQVRLSDMYLSDKRRWQFEIVPAAFILVDYQYASEAVRHPFFVSNKLLSGLPSDMNAKTWPVRFRDVPVLGPTPYVGGNVALFVGLFQSAVEDRRATLFSVFETLFGSLPMGALSEYLKLANKLSSDIARMLGMEDIKCLLAEYAGINQAAAPRQCYRAYLSAREGKPDIEGLEVRDRTLWRRKGGKVAPVEDTDYCLIRIERLAARNDYGSLDFHATWSEARLKMIERQPQEAQALMLACARQVLVSPDLTEDHKLALIKFYQAKLLAAQVLLDSGPGTRGAPTRAAASASLVGRMASRTEHVRSEAGTLSTPIMEIADLVTEMVRQPDSAPVSRGDRHACFPPLSDDEITAHLGRQRPGGQRQSPRLLLQALTIGSVN